MVMHNKSKTPLGFKIQVILYSNRKNYVMIPGDFPPTSSKISSQSALRSMQNFGGPFDVRNVLTTSIICLTCHEMLIQWSFWKSCEKQVDLVRET